MYCFRIRRPASWRRITRQRRPLKMLLGRENAKLCSNVCAKQLQINDQVEQARALNSVKLLQESILFPEDEEDYTTIGQFRRPASPDDYTLAIDFTAAKMVTAVADKCKLFQCVSAFFKEESNELLATLDGLFEILQTVLVFPRLNKVQEVLEDVMLYTTKAYAFMEKLCFMSLPDSTHGVHKAGMRMNEFACRFFNYTVRLCRSYEMSMGSLGCVSPRVNRLSYGVTTYLVPVENVAEILLKNKRVHIPLTDYDGKSEYNVELSYPRTWFSKDIAVSAKVESKDRGFSQTLQADRVKIEKGSWGWEEAQDTVLITYDDLVVANVASVSGSLLTYMKHSSHNSVKPFHAQKYRTSILIVGSSRIDLDLQNLFIKGVKEKEIIYYKCFVNTTGREEVLGVYRYQQKQPQKAEGMLHIVGRGNQPGLRHVLVSIFASLGLTAAV